MSPAILLDLRIVVGLAGLAAAALFGEPSYWQTSKLTLGAGLVSTALSHPFEFIKTRIQVINEGFGVRGIRLTLGYNPYRVFAELHEKGYGSRVLYTG